MPTPTRIVRLAAFFVIATAPFGDARADHRDIGKLFATSCGWCHEGGGRKAGKGPQLMHSKRDDKYLKSRIKKGKRGRMPAFRKALTEQDIDEIIFYIRTLEPES